MGEVKKLVASARVSLRDRVHAFQTEDLTQQLGFKSSLWHTAMKGKPDGSAVQTCAIQTCQTTAFFHLQQLISLMGDF